MPLEDSVGQLFLNDVRSGTAWVISGRFAVTAWHCFQFEGSDAEIKVSFFGKSQLIGFRLARWDVALDVVLLEFADSAELPPPLKLLATPQNHAPFEPPWFGRGYTKSVEGELDHGFQMSGSVNEMNNSKFGSPRVVLNCTQGHGQLDRTCPLLGGASGGPVASPDHEDRVFAMLSWTDPQFGEQFITAPPVSAIHESFSKELHDLVLAPWDERQGFAVASSQPVGDGMLSNISQQLVDDAWEGKLTGVWCDVRSDESPELRTALLRLVIHAEAVGGTELFLSDAPAWKSRSWALVDRGFPTLDRDPDGTVNRYQWSDSSIAQPPQGGDIFTTPAELGVSLHEMCDTWVLGRLRRRMEQWIVTDDSKPLGCRVSPDIRHNIEALWTTWHQELEQNAKVLRNFLTLTLAASGNDESLQAVAAIGPKTIDSCMFPTLVFSLSVCSCVSEPPHLANLKHPIPGNLGNDELPGHACGVKTIAGRHLRLSLPTHRWETPVVLLTHCDTPWSVVTAQSEPIRRQVGEAIANLANEPNRQLVIALDPELMIAMESGVDAVRECVGRLAKDFVAIQADYLNASGAI